MTNLFEVLGLPETLRLEPVEVDQAWEEVTRRHHPDVAESGDDENGSAEANRAREVLKDPTGRLEHWLRLRGVEPRRDQSISPELMDLFSRLNPILSRTDTLLARLEKTSTALAKAMLAKESAAAQVEIQMILGEIMRMKGGLLDRFGEFEDAASEDDFGDASRALAQLKFLRKWEQQGQARLVTLLSG